MFAFLSTVPMFRKHSLALLCPLYVGNCDQWRTLEVEYIEASLISFAVKNRSIIVRIIEEEK